MICQYTDWSQISYKRLGKLEYVGGCKNIASHFVRFTLRQRPELSVERHHCDQHREITERALNDFPARSFDIEYTRAAPLLVVDAPMFQDEVEVVV